MKSKLLLSCFILIFIITMPLTGGMATVFQQETTPEQKAQELLQKLQPEESVGQLFLVTFTGPEAGPSTPIYDLITNYHIGGTISLRNNDNFIAADQTLPIIQNLNRQLQAVEYASSQQDQNLPGSEEKFRPTFIPLLIGISQEGDGYPYDQILQGMTPLPSLMTLGATWDPENAKQVGIVLGTELVALGFNLLLGPSLDVLEMPHPESSGDLGVRTFGGDPFWVGEMGKAYIAGIHQGGNGEIAVVAKHFPGFGSSDRLPEEEVATVRKSLDQLKYVDLAPFFAVTGNSPSNETTVDALLTAHILYQGFTENPRATTKPVSFDPEAFNKLMTLAPIDAWRQKGGVMISDDLGGEAVRRFYATSGQDFIGRYVARDAFLAGNDLLYLGNFSSVDEPDSYLSIIRTLEFFNLKYREDDVFAQLVDQAALRVLTLKYKLYKNIFTLTQVIAPAVVPGTMGTAGQITFDITKQAATLISPSQDELNLLVPEPPGRNDRIVFLTDTRFAKQCTNCPLLSTLDVNIFQQVIIRMYSPQAGGQVLPANITSYSFDDLKQLIETGSGVLQIESDLLLAKWIVVAMLNPDPDIPSALAFQQFLAQRPDLCQQKRIIVFAMNAPYYLDATNISKLTAYYALYNKSSKAIDVAARLLFQEIRPGGSLPVSVKGVGYDINDATFPDPDQIIPLYLDVETPPESTETATPQATPTQILKIGDTIPVRTGIIYDHNGHPVPDKTVVRFIITHGDASQPQTVEAETIDAVARAIIRVDNSGVMEIRVESEPATQSDILRFDIPAPTEQVIEVEPTNTQVPTHTPTATSTITPSPSLTPTVTPTPLRTHTNFNEWFLALIATMVFGVIAFWLTQWAGHIRWGFRSALLTLIGGLLAYSYLASGLPGSVGIIQSGGTWGIIGITILGAGMGWGAALGWRGLTRK